MYDTRDRRGNDDGIDGEGEEEEVVDEDNVAGPTARELGGSAGGAPSREAAAFMMQNTDGVLTGVRERSSAMEWCGLWRCQTQRRWLRLRG